MEMASEAEVTEVISSFHCKIDPDIENFLYKKSVEFEQLSKSRTYFLVDADQLECGKYEVLAYFSVALHVLKVNNWGLSNREIKQLDGLYSKRHGSVITEFPVFLIGQLAKNDKYPMFDGSIALEYALSTIEIAHDYVGGRLILVESKNIDKLLAFYVNNDFEVYRQDDDKLVQLVKIIEE